VLGKQAADTDDNIKYLKHMRYIKSEESVKRCEVVKGVRRVQIYSKRAALVAFFSNEGGRGGGEE
jgi:hypothetical protein